MQTVVGSGCHPKCLAKCPTVRSGEFISIVRQPMQSNEHIAAAYQSLGEFVVTFQWVEDVYRQIGWFILDPERKNWPPMQLRTEKNHELIDKVTSMFVDLTTRHAFPNGPEKVEDILDLQPRFHELRKYRNRLLHSTYVELKIGDELVGYLRAHPKISVDQDTGELLYDQEPFTAESVRAKLLEYGQYAFRLSQLYLQLIHWSPFARYARVA